MTYSEQIRSIASISALHHEGEEERRAYLVKREDTMAPAAAVVSKREEDGSTPQLEEPKKDYLEALAETYIASIDALCSGAEVQMEEYQKLQTFNQEVAQCQLIINQNAMTSQKASLDAYTEETKKEQEEDATRKALTIVSYCVAALLTLCGVGGAIYGYFFAAGTAAAGTAAGEAEAASVAVAEGAEGAIGTTVDQAAGRAMEEAAERVAENGAQNAERSLADLQADAQPNPPSWFRANAINIAKTFFRMGIAGVTSAPMIYDGQVKGRMAEAYNTLANYEEETGKNMAMLKRIDGYTKYFQSSQTRTASVIEGQAEEEGQAIEVASNIFAIYGQVARGLAPRRG